MTKLHQAVFYSTTLRTLLEGYIELALCATINLFHLQYTLSGDRASAILAVGVAFFTYLTPLGLLLFIIQMRKRLHSKEVEARYGSLYEGLKTKRVAYLLCTFIFVSRRLLLIMVAIMLQDHPTFQVMIYILASELSLMYIVYFKPYDSLATNYNEIFNEACVLLFSYQLFIFTDFVSSIEVKAKMGYLMIFTILMNFGVNILIQLIHGLSLLPRACRGFKNRVQSWLCPDENIALDNTIELKTSSRRKGKARRSRSRSVVSLSVIKKAKKHA